MLPQQTDIDQRPQRHPAVGRGLELQQQHQVGVAAATPRDPPDHVAFAPLACFSMEFGVQPLHAIKIEVVEPGLGNEIAKHLSDHPRMAEQLVVNGVVVGHPPALP